jgi:hypothetical protein
MKQSQAILIFAQWTLLTTLGYMVGVGVLGPMAGEEIGYAIGNRAEALIHKIFTTFPSGYAPSMIAGFIYGTAGGLITGIFQWVVLRSWLDRAWGWVILTMIGSAVSFSLNSWVGAVIFSFMEYTVVTNLLLAIITGPLTGFITGFLQWFMLRKKFDEAFWWVFASMIGSTIAVIVSITSYTLIITFTDNVELSVSIEAVIGAVSGFLLAISTGFALLVLLRNRKPSGSPENTAASTNLNDQDLA